MRSFRRNLAASSSRPSSGKHTRQEGSAKDGLFVKINMDGVPIGRKVDLTAYGVYADLSAAVGKLFRGLLAGTYPPCLVSSKTKTDAAVLRVSPPCACLSVVASS